MDALDKYWYRVKDLRIGMRSHVDIHRHIYRDRLWYVVQDHVSGRFFRFSEDAYQFIGKLDSKKTLDQIWNEVSISKEQMEVEEDFNNENLSVKSTSKGELIRLLSQFYRADLLTGDVLPNTKELIERSQVLKDKLKMQKFRSPIAVRVPLFDPNNFINKTWPIMRIFFNSKGFLFWLFTMFYGAFLLVTNWQEFSSDVFGKLLSAENILLLIVLFPIVKILHEFGHAYVIKAMKGEVHEMGVIFLIFMPVMYVDASASSANRNKYQRALVGAAGMIVELFIAVIALYIWSEAEPGLIKAIAYNVVLIAGISTLFFNANPLVRFDGYYILSDLVEIPNLASRANQYIGYLYQKNILRLTDLSPPDISQGEPKWLFNYAVAAFLYRLFIVFAIVTLLLNQYFFFGFIMAVWAGVLMLLMPILKGIRFLFTSRKLKGMRFKALFNTAAFMSFFLIVLTIPVPFSVISEGVIWVDNQAWVRNQTQGFVEEYDIQILESVRQGQPIAKLSNENYSSQLNRLFLNLVELEAQYDAIKLVDRVQAGVIQNQIDTLKSRIVDYTERLENLTVRSQHEGEYFRINEKNIKDTFLQKGSLLGFVSKSDQTIVRVVVKQSDIGLVRNELIDINVRFADDIERIVSADIVREIPSASQTLPSLALSSVGGGSIVLDPAVNSSVEPSSIQSFFQVDLKIIDNIETIRYGGRVFVKFKFNKRSLFQQIYRPIKQTFLSKLV